MALKINATRRVSLEGFAIGWDNCYLIVRALSEAESTDLSAQVEAAGQDDAKVHSILTAFCNANILRGVILNTNEEGDEERYEIKKNDVPEVTAALGLAWKLEVLSIASGSDRLKLPKN